MTSLPVRYVASAALVSGASAHVIDRLLAHYLPNLLLPGWLLDEVEATRTAIRRVGLRAAAGCRWRRRIAAAIRRDQDARSAGIGPTATRMRIEAERIEAERLEEQSRAIARRDRASASIPGDGGQAELARRRDALVARSSWNQVRRQGRR